jgi:integrase
VNYSVKAGGVAAPRFMDRVRERLRVKHYSLRTEQAYVGWIRRFILANGKRHPQGMGAEEVERFLTSLAVQRDVAASTQNQALAALLFLYREVLNLELAWMESIVRAKRPARIPVVLSAEEVARLLAMLEGREWLLAALLYGTGMRLMECIRLRVKDVDFACNVITVREGKGGKDRRVPLPVRTAGPLRLRVESTLRIQRCDIASGFGAV